MARRDNGGYIGFLRKLTPVSVTNGNGGIWSLFEQFVAATASVWSGSNVVATGGTVTTINDYRFHVFTSSANLVVTRGGAINYAIIGGGGTAGGQAGNSFATGGGGGGVLQGSTIIPSGTFPAVVGAGGAGGSTSNPWTGRAGNNSSFNSLIGGGGSGGTYATGTGAKSGSPQNNTSVGTGGAGALFGSYDANGKAGIQIPDLNGIAGQTGYFGGGGGGTGGTTASLGGGGKGGTGLNGAAGAAGVANTGGGSGTGPDQFVYSGGSGVVVIWYPY